MSIFSMFGTSNRTNSVKEFYKNGAIVIDVRTSEEFAYGHIENSKNIPLHEIQTRLSELKKYNKPVIACCQSGSRSGMAERLLKSNGIECVNGGSWQGVKAAIS